MTDPRYVKGVVTFRRNVEHGLWIVRVQPEEKIPFLAGQYVTVGLPGATKMVERPYSVASSPHAPELEFFLELIPGGSLTPQLYNVPEGGEVQLRNTAKGRLLFDAESGHPNHFMVSTVTGVAPFLSMLREKIERFVQGEPVSLRIVLVHAGSVSEELAYGDELSTISRDYDWFDYIPTVSRPWLNRSWLGELGRAEDIARKHLDALGFTPENTTAYVCGNPNMIANVKGVLKRAGFEDESVKEEFFWVVPKVK